MCVVCFFFHSWQHFSSVSPIRRASTRPHGNIINSSAAMWQLSHVCRSNIDIQMLIWINTLILSIQNKDMEVTELWLSRRCLMRRTVQQGRVAWSLRVFGKPTSGDLESGRSGNKEEAGRLRASVGSFPVYTGGINGKQQENVKCVCALSRGLKDYGLGVHTHTHTSFTWMLCVLIRLLSFSLRCSYVDSWVQIDIQFCISHTQKLF